MAEPRVGTSGGSSVSAPGCSEHSYNQRVQRSYYEELTEMIESAAHRLQVYLSTVQLCKRQVTGRRFDVECDGPLVESAFLSQTMDYISTVYADIKALERSQGELSLMVEGDTEHWEELPTSRTTRAHLRHSQQVVSSWLALWWQPLFGRRRGGEEGESAVQSLQRMLELSAFGGGVAGGVGLGGVHLRLDMLARANDFPDVEELEGVEDEEIESWNEELNSQRAIEDSEGNGNSNGDSCNGNGGSNGNGGTNGSGPSSAEGSGTGNSGSAEASLSKYKAPSAKRLVVTPDSHELLLPEMYRQHGILRRELLRHTHCLWFVTRVRHQRDDRADLVAKLARTLATIEREADVARQELARRADAVRRFGDAMWPRQRCQPPPTPPPSPPPPPPPPPEDTPSEIVPAQDPAGGFFRRLFGRIWFTLVECIPQRRNFEW